MATVTTNYSFDVPQSSDLVKDGATAIALLGQDIDTAMFTALGTKKAGMVLLNTTSFSGVASQSINDVFSATYTNYRICWEGVGTTSQNDLNLRARVSGSDNSSSNYYWAKSGWTYTNSADQYGPNALQSSISIGVISSTGSQSAFFDVANPFSSSLPLGLISNYKSRIGNAATLIT